MQILIIQWLLPGQAQRTQPSQLLLTLLEWNVFIHVANLHRPGSRAKPDSRTSGRKGNGQYDRLNNSSESSSQDSNGKKTKKKTKVEDSQTGASNDSKQKKSESRWR